MSATITITESSVQYDSLNITENETFSSLRGSKQNLDEIPYKNKNWRTIVVTA